MPRKLHIRVKLSRLPLLKPESDFFLSVFAILASFFITFYLRILMFWEWKNVI